MPTVRRVYLSPHLDDAVLSCGASIAQQAANGESIEVLTIFAGRPPLRPLSSYAAQMHEKWGNPPDPMGRRREEDEAACHMLGVIAIHLDYLDAIYRTDPANGAFLYTSDEQLMGGLLHPADLGLADDLTTVIAQRYRNVHDVLIYAPLGAGGHVDHQIVRAAAFKLQQRGFSLCFYEDFPHVEEGHALVSALAQPDGCAWAAELRLLQEPYVTMKREAIGCYRSQISILFGDVKAMAQRMRIYMTLVGNDAGYAERFWKPYPLPSP